MKQENKIPDSLRGFLSVETSGRWQHKEDVYFNGSPFTEEGVILMDAVKMHQIWFDLDFKDIRKTYFLDFCIKKLDLVWAVVG